MDFAVSAININHIHALVGTIVTFLLYGMIGPLTSIYLGNTIGNSLFSFGEGKSQQFIGMGMNLGKSIGKKVLARKKHFKTLNHEISNPSREP